MSEQNHGVAIKVEWAIVGSSTVDVTMDEVVRRARARIAERSDHPTPAVIRAAVEWVVEVIGDEADIDASRADGRLEIENIEATPETLRAIVAAAWASYRPSVTPGQLDIDGGEA